MRRAVFIAFWTFWSVWVALVVWAGEGGTGDSIMASAKNARFAALAICICLFGHLFATRRKSR